MYRNQIHGMQYQSSRQGSISIPRGVTQYDYRTASANFTLQPLELLHG